MNGPADEHRNNAHEYISTLRQHFATYHDHKEQMSFGATALYLTGVTALVIQSDTAWAKVLPCWATILLAVMFIIIAVAFISWQLSMRAFAARIVEASTNLTTRWLHQWPSELDTTPVPYEGKLFPKFFVGELRSVSTRGPMVPSIITLITVGIWSVLLILRIAYP